MTLSGVAFAQTQVDGYIRRDGTYVAPHYRSSPNSNTFDNYSTRGNGNPYTGERGTRDPFSAPSSGYGSSYGSGSSSTYRGLYGGR